MITETAIEKLDTLWTQAKKEVSEDGKTYIVQDRVADDIEDICWQYLILPDELDWNRKNVKKVQKHGYRCYAGEKDSYGMLTACVEKDGAIFCFG